MDIRQTFLKIQGGRIDRAEVRKRAGNAMLRNLPTFQHCVNEAREWAIIGGGSSINTQVENIRRLKDQGANIVTVNKSHDWALEHDIVPWGHVLLDPKEWVADYVKRPRKDVRYFVASQCHDSVFENLKDSPVFLWHAGQDFDEGPEPEMYLRERWPKTPWYVVPGPTTVGLRATQLGHAMGADWFHLIGFDSCRQAGKMHGYAKDEAKDSQSGVMTRMYRGNPYRFDTNCHMARQVFDFDKLIEELPEHYANGRLRKDFGLTVYGSGFLPFIAAILGLHADERFNKYPELVGGWIPEPKTFISDPAFIVPTLGPTQAVAAI